MMAQSPYTEIKMNLESFKSLVISIDEEKIKKLSTALASREKVIVIGNGGSNAIASHISVDYTKLLRKKCLTFSDASMLTCFMNDEGVENAYKEYLSNFADEETLTILISSSGNSPNIYQAALYCKNNNIPFIILTGFSETNKVHSNFADDALLDIWVDSKSYAIVECLHMIYLHAVVDV